MKNKYKILFVLILTVFFLQAFGAEVNKVYDPLEPIDKTIPPNILVVVDNSGSMNLDTNNIGIFDFRTNTVFYRTVGDFWHYNVNGQATHGYSDYPSTRADRVAPYSLFDYYSSTYFVQLTGVNVNYATLNVNENDKTDLVGIAVDIWADSDIDRDDLNIVVTLEKDGQSFSISPEDQWFRYYSSDGSANSGDSVYVDGRYYYRYRVQYVFPDFYGLDKQGTWNVKMKTLYSGSKRIFFERAGITFNPILSKMGALKVVLQRIIKGNPDIRLALGTYRTGWSYYNYDLFDGAGNKISGHYWYVTSSSPGLGMLVEWPSDYLATDVNRDDLYDWVGLDEIGANAYEYYDYTHEIFAGGYTPIQSCMAGIKDYLDDKYSSDIYSSCRNYAVVYLTDGQCTEGGCSNSVITTTISNIYKAHEITLGTSNIGTKTYVIGLSMSEGDRDILNEWADAGDDGNSSNNSKVAYMPNNSEELMQAFADAIYEASQQELVINSDVIFGTVDPNLAANFSDTFKPRTIYFIDDGNGGEIAKNADELGSDDTVIRTEETIYPTIKSNIMFSTAVYYPGWNGTVRAYQPVYQKVVSGDSNNTNLYYFDNGAYPVIWDAKEILSKRISGYTDENGNHVHGIKDALGLNGDVSPSPDFDQTLFRKIKVVTGDSNAYIDLSNFVWDSAANKWKCSKVNELADFLGVSESEATKYVNFLQTRMLADITNSTPAFVGEPEMGFDDWDENYFAFKVDKRKNRVPMVVVGANDCMLHSFNAYTGKEEWAVVPFGVLNSLREMVANYDSLNNPSGQVDIGNVDYLGRAAHIYGVASSPKVVDADVNIASEDNESSWRTYLVCGLGAGGYSYFALDITDTLNPTPVWDKSYSGFGETWSYPALWTYRSDDSASNIGFYTSGYSSDSSKGKTLYVLDTLTGEVIESKDTNGGFLFASPGGILNASLSSINGTYFGDTEGDIYRYLLGGNVCKVYQTEEKTPIFCVPAILQDVDGTEWVAFGEVGKEDKSSSVFATKSKLFTFKYDVCTDSKDLVNLETEIGSSTMYNQSFPLEGKDGFYYSLQQNETAFANPIMTTYYYEEDDGSGGTVTKYEKVSIFVTYRYPESGDACGNGTSVMYIFGVSDLFVGDPEEDGAPDTVIGEGRPGNPVKTGVTNSVWVNSKDGPIRILPLDNNVTANSMPLYYYFSGKNARKIGVGSWFVK
jgi:hypothetical protein